jgi:hypothetical protein
MNIALSVVILCAVLLLIVPAEAKSVETADSKSCDKTDECKDIKVMQQARGRREETHENAAEPGEGSHEDIMKEKANEFLTEAKLFLDEVAHSQH